MRKELLMKTRCMRKLAGVKVHRQCNAIIN